MSSTNYSNSENYYAYDAPSTHKNQAFTYGIFSVVLLTISGISLIPQFFTGIFNGSPHITTALVLHGVAFLLWYVLYTIQSFLIANHNRQLHKKLGYASLTLIVFLIFSGAYMLVGTMQSYQSSWTEQQLFSRTSFVWAISHTLLCFTLFAGLGMMYRKRTYAHRHFMLLASLSMMSASITRFAYSPVIPIDGTLFTLLLTYGLFITPLIIEKLQGRKIHPVLSITIPVYIVTQLLSIGLLPSLEIGRRMAFPF